jgi:hypothetical protein
VKAVKDKGGLFLLQLWHVGRASHTGECSHTRLTVQPFMLALPVCCTAAAALRDAVGAPCCMTALVAWKEGMPSHQSYSLDAMSLCHHMPNLNSHLMGTETGVRALCRSSMCDVCVCLTALQTTSQMEPCQCQPQTFLLGRTLRCTPPR